MSVTTTSNARILTTASYLADYDLHHSQPSDSTSSPAPAPNTHTSSSAAANPPNWETQWNRVPAHRPVRNQLDAQRNTYTSEIERNFVRVMFGGESSLSFQSLIYSWVPFLSPLAFSSSSFLSKNQPLPIFSSLRLLIVHTLPAVKSLPPVLSADFS